MSVTVRRSSRWLVGLLPAVLVAAASGMAFYKIAYLGYNLDPVTESESFYLETVIELDGHGTAVEVTMALPQSGPTQTVSDEAFGSADMRFAVSADNGNRRGRWYSGAVDGTRHLQYTATVATKSLKYVIDSTLPTAQPIPDAAAAELLAETDIQSDSPEIAALADSLGLTRDSTLLFNARKIFDYVTTDLRYVQYSGKTDALTAYRLNEASCGGKSRLMAALARQIGVPARLVGGKILSAGRSRATHIWVEMYVNGYWVPFCPTNNYFAEIPSDYMILYYGEQPVFTHTKDINFKYFFNLKKRLASPGANLESLNRNPLDILNIWSTFKRVAISLELLKIIIMLPIGVLAVVVFRNLVGMETFGTFMPALIAVGFRDTGLANGLLLFGLIILFGALVRQALSRLQLLHTPRLAIILSAVVLFILALTAVGVQLGMLKLARVALFPMVILTLTVERFSIITEESGPVTAAKISVLTMLVASAAYLIMSWRLLQSIVITFPETILLVIAVYIYVGRYSGFRLAELLRFKQLLART